MKKLASACFSAVLAVSVLSTGLLVANATDRSQVGSISSVPARFEGKQDQLSQKYKAAFEWGITLHAAKASDGNFDFGDASGEFVHTWSGTDPEGNVYEICNQDFDGGNSTVAGAFSYKNWAAITCSDADTLNVVILRDAPAELYGKGGGVNNWQFGSPTTNQYWRMEDGIPVLYQQFDNGYLRCEEGETWYSKFHNKIDEGADYVEPPQAPPAYGDIYAQNADGCSWENPKYFPGPNDGNDGPDGPVGSGGTQGPGGTGPITNPSVPTPGGDDEPVNSEDPANPDESGVASGESGVTSTESTDEANVGSNTNKNSSKAANASNTTGGNKKAKLNVGATVGIVAGCVVVLGGGAFCLYWFVLRKKKATEGADEAVVEETKTEEKPEDKK